MAGEGGDCICNCAESSVVYRGVLLVGGRAKVAVGGFSVELLAAAAAGLAGCSSTLCIEFC